MKKTLFTFVILLALSLSSCDFSSLYESSVTVRFNHNWDGEPVHWTDFGELKYQTENGDLISIDSLNYVISRIHLKKENSDLIYVISDVKFIDLSSGSTWVELGDVPDGRYEISFVFGLRDEDNISHIHSEIPASFLVPEIYGGGYHFMHFDGKYLAANNTENPYSFYATKAVDSSNPNNLIMQDTSFEINLGTHYLGGAPFLSQINIEVNLAEWFKNPTTWDLTTQNQNLVIDFNAQLLIKENGKNVFTLGEIYYD